MLTPSQLHFRTSNPPRSRLTSLLGLLALAVWLWFKSAHGVLPQDIYLVLLVPLLPFTPLALPAGVLLADAVELLLGGGDSMGLLAACAAPALLHLTCRRDSEDPVTPDVTPPRLVALRPWFLAAAIGILLVRVPGVFPLVSAFWAGFALHVCWALPAPDRPLRKRIAGALGKALLTGLGVLVGLGLLELGARVVHEHRVPELGFWMMHPEHGRWLRAGGQGHTRVPQPDGSVTRYPVSISAQGIRDRMLEPKAEGEFRIVVLGDSFVFGNGTAQEGAISSHLEAVLRAQNPNRVFTVANLGIGGTGPIEQRAFLHERGWPLEPDLVLHGLFPANDITDSLLSEATFPRAYDPSRPDALIYHVNRRHPLVQGHLWLARVSHSYDAARHGLLGGLGLLPIAAALRFVPPLTVVDLAPSAPRPAELEADLRAWYPALERGFDMMAGHIARIAGDCSDRGIQYIAFCIPQFPDLTPEIFQHFTAWDGGDEAYAWRKAIDTTQAFLDDAGIPSVDIVTALSQHPAPETLYHLYDGHLNAEGNRLVAEILANAPFRTGARAVAAPTAATAQEYRD